MNGIRTANTILHTVITTSSVSTNFSSRSTPHNKSKAAIIGKMVTTLIMHQTIRLTGFIGLAGNGLSN